MGWVSVLESGARTRLVLGGELDETVYPDLTEAVDYAVTRAVPVDIDARSTTFMDSSAVVMLAHLASRLPERPRLIEPPEILRFLLDVTDLNQAMDVVEADPGFDGTPPSFRRDSAPDATPA